MYDDDDAPKWQQSFGLRFLILLISAAVGLVIYLWGVPIFESAIGKKLGIPLRQLPATVLTLIALWYFRSYDVRQQIDEARTQNEVLIAQNQQTRFNKGMEQTLKKNQDDINTGVTALIEVSELTPTFDNQIQSVFIRCLQNVPSGVDENNKIEIRDPRISPYTEKIFWWLRGHINRSGATELVKVNILYKEFDGVEAKNSASMIVRDQLHEVTRSLGKNDPLGIRPSPYRQHASFRRDISHRFPWWHWRRWL